LGRRCDGCVCGRWRGSAMLCTFYNLAAIRIISGFTVGVLRVALRRGDDEICGAMG